MKERIVGAAILVLFAVLVVPIFLDGPPDSAERVTERVLLPGQDARKTQTVVLERNRTEPVPVAGKTSGAASRPAPDGAREPVKQPETVLPVVEKVPGDNRTTEELPAEKPPAKKPAEQEPKQQPKQQPNEQPNKPEVAIAKPPEASATGMWAVQLGSFSVKANAEKLAADLRKQGYAAFLSQLATDSGSLHRVRIGPQKDRPSAEATASRLKKAGHAGQVVPHP